ncbi:MAG: D-glucuronyl C5-epimerase family protein [Candidatus Thiodiazotropha sp.]
MRKIIKLMGIFTLILFVYLSFSSVVMYNKPGTGKRTDWSSLDYYVTFAFSKENEQFRIDKKGVTYVDYSKSKSLGVKNITSYNPVIVGFQGLRYYQDYKNTHNNISFKRYLTHADWLVENISDDGSWYLTYDKNMGKYTLHSPWKSALSQGFGISLLTRAYIDTGNQKYINSARKALEPFSKYLDEDGVRSKNTFGEFYEEYPIKVHPTHVLNGFIYSLFGLYDLYIIDNNIEAKELFDEGIATLKKVLPEYDLGNWTRYNLDSERNLKNHWGYSSPRYQKIHAAQLYGLHYITKDPYFRKYADKFEAQNRRSWINLVIYPAYILYRDFVAFYRFAMGKNMN